jgi:hypothetical protein
MSLYDKASIALIPSGTKASKLYSVLPANGDGDFTHSRSLTTATRVNKDGLIESVAANVPRLDYPLTNGIVGDCPHLLLEPSETNYQIRSEEFDNSAYQKTRSSITANQIVSPDGTLTADLFTEDTSNNSHYLYDTLVVSADSYTVSVFAKAKDRYKIKLRFDNVSTRREASFDINSGSVISTTNSTATIKQFPNNWYRCSITVTSTATTFYNFIHILDDSGNEAYAGDGSSGLYIWGSQIERSSYLTSYIPTSGSIVTRSQDFCNNSGTSADINSEEGVLFAELATLDKDDTSSRRISISDSTTNNVIRLTFDVASNRLYAVVYKSGTIWATYTTLSNSEDFNKVALKYKPSDFDFYVNGVKVQQQSSGATFDAGTMSEVAFDNGGGGNLFFGKIKQLIVFNEALTDSELATLTS